jgi:hypothetical protein
VGSNAGFLEHFTGAIGRVFTGDLAAFFGGDIDHVQPAGWTAWVHAAAALLAVGILIHRNRAEIARFLQSRKAPVALLPAIFVIVYLGMYGAAKYSLPELRSPRYLLPLCPFVSIAIGMVVASWTGARRWVGLAVVAFLVVSGAVASLDIGLRNWHEEHRIRTYSSDMAQLAAEVKERHIRLAFAPYQIQWRLMFATDEAVLVSNEDITAAVRYPYYEKTVWSQVQEGEEFAFILRRDFKFEEWAWGQHMGFITHDIWQDACRRAGISPEGIPVGQEFMIFYPLKLSFLRTLGEAIKAAPLPPAGGAGRGG